jgi:dUTPase
MILQASDDKFTPFRGSSNDIGVNVFAVHDYAIEPQELVKLDLGVKINHDKLIDLLISKYEYGSFQYNKRKNDFVDEFIRSHFLTFVIKPALGELGVVVAGGFIAIPLNNYGNLHLPLYNLSPNKVIIPKGSIIADAILVSHDGSMFGANEL